MPYHTDPEAEAEKQVRQLSSLSKRRRAEAFQRLSELGPEGLRALHCVIREESDRWEVRRAGLGCLLLMGTMFAVPITCEVIGIPGWNDPIKAIIASGMVAVIASCCSVGITFLVKPASKYQACLIALASLGDISSIEWLIKGLSTANKATHPAVSSALTRLLPLLDKNTASKLGWSSTELLYRQLSSTDAPLITATLNLIVVLRDNTELPAMEQLNLSEAPAARDANVRTALESALTVIREIHMSRTGPSTLLRAGNAENSLAATGLRAVSEPVEMRSEELLRAVRKE